VMEDAIDGSLGEGVRVTIAWIGLFSVSSSVHGTIQPVVRSQFARLAAKNITRPRCTMVTQIRFSKKIV